jgi:hypothetical protein
MKYKRKVQVARDDAAAFSFPHTSQLGAITSYFCCCIFLTIGNNALDNNTLNFALLLALTTDVKTAAQVVFRLDYRPLERLGKDLLIAIQSWTYNTSRHNCRRSQ